jgi:hypothetical protein
MYSPLPQGYRLQTDPMLWRLVCHGCGRKLEPGAVTAAQCCEHTEWHIHNIAAPCEWCRDD